MWRMNDGNRVFTDAEWNLFVAGLDFLRSSVEDDIRYGANDTETGVRVFDTLTPEQQLALLADVGHALRDPGVPLPRHTAANEGAIAAVFEQVRVLLDLELDTEPEAGGPDPTEVRRLIRAAAWDHPDRPRKLPSPTRATRKVWENLLEEIEARVFWDQDYAMADEFLDLPPEVARAELARLTIDPDYFLAVPREPGGAGLIAARQTLARLLGLPVPDDDGLYPVLYDLYHHLFVGPCSPEVIDLWVEHPWVQLVASAEPDWDCDYPTWLAAFRDAVPAAPFALGPAGAGDTSPGWPDGIRAERQENGWVVRDRDGSYWCGLVDNCWTGDPDEDVPALVFPSEGEARSAYAQADRMYAERTRRHAEAARLLGFEEAD